MTLLERLKTKHGVATQDLKPEELTELKWLFKLGIKIQASAFQKTHAQGWITPASGTHPWSGWYYRLKQ